MKHKCSAILLGMVTANPAMASDPTGLLQFFGGQILFLVAPFFVPLFFLKDAQKKWQNYLLMLLVVFGVISLVRFFTQDLILQFAPWTLSSPPDTKVVLFMVVASKIIGIIISIAILLRLAPRLRQAVDGPTTEELD